MARRTGWSRHLPRFTSRIRRAPGCRARTRCSRSMPDWPVVGRSAAVRTAAGVVPGSTARRCGAARARPAQKLVRRGERVAGPDLVIGPEPVLEVRAQLLALALVVGDDQQDCDPCHVRPRTADEPEPEPAPERA